jgi:hypothetical protein
VKYLYVLGSLFILPLALAGEGKKFSGIADGSVGNLEQVCLNYMQEGFIKNNPLLYLTLLPPEAADMETDIIASFDRHYYKRFNGMTSPEYEVLAIKSKKVTVVKGKSTVAFRLHYKGVGAEKSYRGNCYFVKHNNGKWYFGTHP